MREAFGLSREPWFREELQALKSNGVFVCSAKSKLTVRTASAEERGKHLSGAVGVMPPSDEVLLFYLVEIDGDGRAKDVF